MNKYSSKKILGSGGFGTAELVERNSDKKLFVIKTVNFHGDKRRKIFGDREVKILEKARHYNIVRYHEHFYVDGAVKIVLAYCDGGDLGKIVKKQSLTKKDFDDMKVLEWLSQLLFGLKYLHEIKVIHRDLKPGNLLLSSSQRRLLIADFGLSRSVKSRGLASSTHIGTPNYMAPELFGDEKYTVDVDIWSTGCIIYKIVNLTEAFSGDNVQDVKRKILTSTYDEPKRKFCDEIIKKCLQKKGSDRPEVEELINMVDDEIEAKATFQESYVVVHSPSVSETTSHTVDNSTVVPVETAQSSENLLESSSAIIESDSQLETSLIFYTALTSQIESSSSEDQEASRELSSDQEVVMSNIETSVLQVYKHQALDHAKDKFLEELEELNSRHGSYPWFLWINDDHFCSFGWSVRDAKFTHLREDECLQTEIGETTCATLRLDGKVVTGNKNGEVHLWSNGVKLKSQNVHNKEVHQMCSLTENRIFTASRDGTVNVLGPNFEEIIQMKGSEKAMYAIASIENTVATGDAKGMVWYYDLESRLWPHEQPNLGWIHKTFKPNIFNGHTDSINSLSLKKGFLVSGSDDKTVRLWKPNQSDQPVSTMVHDDIVTAVMFGAVASQSRLFSCSWDMSTATWNIETGQRLNSIKHPGHARCLDIHPNEYLAATGHDYGVSISDLRTQTVVKEVGEHSNGKIMETHKVKFSPNGQRIGITENCGSVKVCELRF